MRDGAKVCQSCKAPVRRPAEYRDPNHGKCEWNDHGHRCTGTGSIALSTHEGAPWYCRKHAFGSDGFGAKKKGQKGFAEFVEKMRKQFANFRAEQAESEREAQAEREAIKAE